MLRWKAACTGALDAAKTENICATSAGARVQSAKKRETRRSASSVSAAPASLAASVLSSDVD